MSDCKYRETEGFGCGWLILIVVIVAMCTEDSANTVNRHTDEQVAKVIQQCKPAP